LKRLEVKELETALNMMSEVGWKVVIYPEKLPTFEHSFVIVARHPRYQQHLTTETAGEIQRRTILMSLAMTNNNVNRTATRLGIDRKTLYLKLKKMGMTKRRLFIDERKGSHGGNRSVRAV